jgi:hypothetical protein
MASDHVVLRTCTFPSVHPLFWNEAGSYARFWFCIRNANSAFLLINLRHIGLALMVLSLFLFNKQSVSSTHFPFTCRLLASLILCRLRLHFSANDRLRRFPNYKHQGREIYLTYSYLSHKHLPRFGFESQL